MEDLIILYSGGADSNVLLELALIMKKKPYCILIDYNQKHIEELDFAQKRLNKRNVRYQIVSIKNLNINSGLTGSKEKNLYENVHENYVPSRNMMFVSIAASIAESKGIDTIWYGPNYDDYVNRFPDCVQEWIGRMNELLKVNSTIDIKLEAPLIGFTKERVIELSNFFEIKDYEVFSGYGE